MDKEFRPNLLPLKQLAFTLAETLIVMGIIGVVAALTLPNLNSSTGEKEKVAKVKKIYSNLSDAVGRAQAVYGPVEEWCANYSGSCKARHFDRITEFMKISKKCDYITACMLQFDNNGSGGASGDFFAILSDGTIISLHSDFNMSTTNLTDYPPSFKFDIDGLNKGADQQGKDVFEFFYDNNGIYAKDIMSNTSMYVHNYDYFDGAEAAAWIINFDNMDYLKTSDGTTCPDGKTKLTSGGNHSCK